MRRILLTSLLALATAPAAADNAALRLRQFLDAHGRQDGLPQGEAATAIAPHLSAALNAAIAAAREQQAAFRRAHPDRAPPFAGGRRFTSLVQAPFTAYAPVLPAGGCRAPRCMVRVEFVDTVASPDLTWHDEFVLVFEDGRWRIDDVVYRATFAAGNTGSLRAWLEATGGRGD